MAYTPTNWVDGVTPISAANLNNIEGGVNDNADAISELQENPVIHRIYVTGTDTRSTSFEYTGVSVTIPARSVFVISAMAVWNANSPTAVGISSSDTSWRQATAQAYAEPPIDGAGTARCVLVYQVSSETTYYVWGSWSSNTSNNVIINGFYFNY